MIMFTTIDSIRFFPCFQARQGSLVCGRRRPDEQCFGSMVCKQRSIYGHYYPMFC